MLSMSSPGLQRGYILLGEKIKANSWVVGVKVFADIIWQKVLSGEISVVQFSGLQRACLESSIWIKWK
jgi:hypothetical protein